MYGMNEQTNTEALATRLREIASRSGGDPESAHVEADQVLLEFIGDPTVTEAFGEIEKWYA